VVVTFDDGYADNLWNAKPILEKYDLPATVFVTSGHIGSDREFWWDELDRLLLQGGTLPERLRLSLNGTSYEWEFGELAHAGMPQHQTPPYRSLHQLLRPLPEAERRPVLDELLAWAGAEPVGRSTYRALSPDELFRLAEGNLVEVGAHTVSHPVLSALPATAQLAEVQESKARLEEILGRPVISFAYPYGTRSDYTSETVAVVREAGFACACSNFSGVVRRRTDRFQLPRVIVRDWDGTEFARRLRECLAD
jgi:peptidoglycan/xylan/chitin deacetylase (PgdA/CDA1 family)